jgi:hypothetical protein
MTLVMVSSMNSRTFYSNQVKFPCLLKRLFYSIPSKLTDKCVSIPNDNGKMKGLSNRQKFKQIEIKSSVMCAIDRDRLGVRTDRIKKPLDKEDGMKVMIQFLVIEDGGLMWHF